MLHIRSFNRFILIVAAAFVLTPPIEASAAVFEICSPPTATSYDVAVPDSIYNCDYTVGTGGADITSLSGSLSFVSSIAPLNDVLATTDLILDAGETLSTAKLEWFDLPGGTALVGLVGFGKRRKSA